MIRIEDVWSRELIESYEDFATRIKCPICRNETFDSWTICPHCGWEYDHTDGYSDANRTYKWIYRLKFKLQRAFRIKRL